MGIAMSIVMKITILKVSGLNVFEIEYEDIDIYNFFYKKEFTDKSIIYTRFIFLLYQIFSVLVLIHLKIFFNSSIEFYFILYLQTTSVFLFLFT